MTYRYGGGLALGKWLEAHREDYVTAASVYQQSAGQHYTVEYMETAVIFSSSQLQQLHHK